VFVVDDDTSVRRSLRRLFRSAGYSVEEFASAGEFLERKTPSGTGCLVLDVRMPNMTGTELFDRLVRSGSSLPAVFLTGHGDVPTSVHAMKGGAADFLLKPVDAETLLRAVREAVGRHAALRALEEKQAAAHARLSRLSPREREVMERVARGLANKVIASDLGITEKTVKVHRHRVMEKTGTRSVAELVRLVDADAASSSTLPPPPPLELPSPPGRRSR
jgi:FixJ family two-component response regulator